MKTLVIGIDSATWSVLESMIRAGELPVFERLVAGGASGVLTSTLPPLTPPAWTSIVTGVNPGRHGIWDFVDQDPASYRVTPLDFGRMQTPAIWDIYAAHQRRVGVMNFPLAYPPPTVDDFFVSGICSPETGVFTHPASLMADIRAHDYRIYPRLGPGAGPRRYLRAIRELTRRQLDLFADLLGRTAPDLAWLVLMGVDWVQHYFWDGGRDPSGPVQTVYRLMDQALGELLSRLDDDWHVLVLSDHGACGIDGVINVNSLLEEWGLLHRKPDLSGPSDRIRNTVMKTTWDLGRRLPFRLKQLLKRAMPGRVREHVLSTIRGQADLHRLIDWSCTRAFATGNMGQIFIHRRGVFAEGIVTDDDYEVVRQDLIDRLKALRHPETGQPLMGEVCRREEICPGSRSERAPDILFTSREFSYQFCGGFGPTWLETDADRRADHDREGMFILSGPHVRKGARVDASVLDIAPTLLYLGGLPVLESMEGRVLTAALTEAIRAERPIKRIPDPGYGGGGRSGYSDRERRQVEDRLSKLGYL